ncbi:hypothetical protein HHK36_000727 [Tetracentron sinense]|uniref:Uncharacterized protein n=1 Tax=Tetracentron sinense TaxID=13715 RepID=A0A835DUA2_TETSI|nr:hypothetical protein HHK36_000727 [Tetracentron sinense]
MANTWNKLKKSLSLRVSSSSSSSISLNAHRSSDFSPDISEIDLHPKTPTSSSSAMRFSRSISLRSTKKTCAICLGNMKPGQGHAIFTAECSHSFHFNCIAASVKHGNHLCPICRSKWKDIPFQAPITVIDPQLNGIAPPRLNSPHSPVDEYSSYPHRQLPQQPPPPTEPDRFSDDEPLNCTSSPTPLLNRRVATIKACTEFPAVPATESPPAFAVLVSVRAPPLPEDARQLGRAPIDLVTVLDVSGSMTGTKLALLKRAVQFVITNLGPADRLAIVTFSSTARRIFPLRRMSDTGRHNAVLAINSLVSAGGTNIVEGLKKGVRVLEERRERNPVSSIILLSDGKDTYNVDNYNHRRIPHNQASSNSRWILDYLNHFASICPSNSKAEEEARQPPTPVHTFGFGSDHDATAMHAISDASGGTFSFIQSSGIIQDAFARCIGGLLSVVAQEIRLTVRSMSPGVSIGLIPSGKYLSEISDQGRRGVIDVGELYADEEKDFLVNISIPVFSVEENIESGPSTPLLNVVCSYKDPVLQEMVSVEGETIEVLRPEDISPMENTVCLEVDRERNRMWVAEGIAEAQGMAEKGNLEAAQSVLANRRCALLTSASAQAGDDLCNWLEAELREIRERMASQELYEESGRAYVLSGMSSHAWQRATTRGDSTTHTVVLSGEHGNQNMSGPVGYETPSMVSMVTRSQTLTFPVGNPPDVAWRLNKSCNLTQRRG